MRLPEHGGILQALVSLVAPAGQSVFSGCRRVLCLDWTSYGYCEGCQQPPPHCPHGLNGEKHSHCIVAFASHGDSSDASVVVAASHSRAAVPGPGSHNATLRVRARLPVTPHVSEHWPHAVQPLSSHGSEQR